MTKPYYEAELRNGEKFLGIVGPYFGNDAVTILKERCETYLDRSLQDAIDSRGGTLWADTLPNKRNIDVVVDSFRIYKIVDLEGGGYQVYDSDDN